MQKEPERQELKIALPKVSGALIKLAAELAGCSVFTDEIGSGLAYMKVKEFKHGDLPIVFKRAVIKDLDPASYEFYTASRFGGKEGRFPAVRFLVCTT